MSPLRIATNANLFVLYYNNPVASKSKERKGGDSDPTSKAYHLTKLFMSGIHLHLIQLYLASGLGVVKQGLDRQI